MEALAEGQIKENALRGGGFTDDEISQWKGETAQHLQDGGFSGQEVRDYFGQKTPDMAPAKAAIKRNLEAVAPEEPKAKREPIDVSPKPVEAKDMLDIMAGAWGNSFLGLMQGQGASPIRPPENSTVAQAFVSNAVQMAGDLPAIAAGVVGGGAIGPAGSVAGAFAVPMALRKVLIDHYEKGDIEDAGDFARRIVDTTLEGAKGAVVGLATYATGGNIAALNAFGSPLVKALTGTATKLAAETVAMTTVSSALEGHLPNRNDFINGAVAIAGLHGITYGVEKVATLPRKLMGIYAETGAPPAETMEAANQDPNLKGELLSENPNLPKGSLPAVIEKTEKLPDVESKIVPEHENTKSEVDAAQEEILGRIGERAAEEKAPLLTRIRDSLDGEYAKHLDKTAIIKNVMEEMGNEEITPENAHVLTRLHAAVEDKVQEFMEHGTRDFNTGEVNGEALKPLLEEYKKATGDESLDKLKAYGIATRTLELGRRGIEQQGTDQHGNAQSPDRIFLNANQNIEPFFDRVVAWKNRSLDYVVESGRYSQELGEKLKDKNARYIPFKKIVEIDELTGKPPTSAKGIKAIGDSLLKLKDPFLSLVEDTGTMIRMAQETHTTNTFIDSILKHQLEERLADLKDAGKPLSPELQVEGAPGEARVPMDPILRLSEKQTGPIGKNQIAKYVDGERTLYDTRPEIAECIRAMSGNQAAASLWTTLLKPFATALRLGTVDNPLFALRHSWRNQLTGPTLSQTALKPFEALLYAPEYLAKGDSYHQFVYDGGAVNSIVKLGKGYLDGEIYKLENKAPFLEKAWNKIKTAGEFSHVAIVMNDNIIRFAEYKRMLESGATRTESAFAAREVLPDFQKQGLQRSALQSVTAFLKVHMLGQARMGQELGTNPMGYIAKNLAYITVPSLLLQAAQWNDDAVDDLPDWQKHNYWPIHVPNWRPANSLAEAMQIKNAYPSNTRQKPDGSWEVNDGTIFRIQKPFTNGIMFGSAIEVSIEAWRKQDPKAFGEFAKSISQSVLAEPIPTALAPVIEHMVNRSFYTNNAIVRQGMENKLPEMQYDRYTSETAKVLGKMISYVPLIRDIGPKDAKLASPMVIDNYLHGWGGTLGHYAIDVLDNGLRAAGVADKEVKPADTLADISFVREFVIRFPNAHPQSVVDFQDRYQQTDRVANSIKQLIKEGDVQGALALQDRYAINMDRLKTVNDALTNMNSAIQKVYRTPDIDPVQKRQLIDSMMYQMTTWAKQGNMAMDEFEKHAINPNKAGSN